MLIIANHAHLQPARTATAWWPDGSADLLLKHLDFCNVDKTVIFPPFACQMDGDIIRANRWAWDQVAQHSDRFIPSGVFFPTGENAKELLNIFKEEGITLAKVHPSVDEHDIADPALEEVYQLAAEYGIVLDYHTGSHGTRLSLARPEKFEDVSFNFPKLRMIFEHL